MAQYAFDIYPSDNPVAGTRLVRLTNGQGVQISYTHLGHGMGSGFISIHTDHADATEVNLHKRAWCRWVRIDTDPEQEIGGIFLDDGDFKALSRQERGGRILTFRGVGGLSILDRYVLGHAVYATGQPCRGDCTTTFEGSPSSTPDMWDWRQEPYGAMLLRSIEEGQENPAAPFAPVTVDWTRTVDSNGNAWEELSDYSTPIGTSVFALYADFLRMGLVVQCTPDLLIQAYRDVDEFRTDRTSATFAAGKTRFAAGVNILDDLPKRIHPKMERTHVLTRRQNGDYQTYSTGGSGEPYFDFLRIDTTSDATAVEKIATNYLTKRAQYVDQATVRHIIGDGVGQYAPGPAGDYWVLDLATIHTGTDEHDFNNQAIEVAAITYEHDEAGNWFAVVQLGAQYIDPRLAALEQALVTTIKTLQPNPPLCQATVPPDDAELSVARLYFTGYTAGLTGPSAGAGSADAPNGVTDDAAWDEVSSTEQFMLTALLSEAGDAATTPWATVSPTDNWDVRQGQLFYALSGDLLTMIQTGGATVRMQAKASSRSGTGINEGAQSMISQLGIRVVSADGSTVRGTALALHSLTTESGSKPWRPWSGQPSAPYVKENRVFPPAAATNVLTAVASAQSGDYLVVEPGLRNLQAAVTTGGGPSLNSSPSYAGDLPDDETSTATLRAYIEFAGLIAGAGSESGTVAGGHEEMVGTSPYAKRCDSKDHVHRDRPPTALDDITQGYPAGRFWYQLDDLTTPTAIVGIWLSVDSTEGAAVWLQFPIPAETSLTVEDGATSVSNVEIIVFDGPTVTDDGAGQVTVAAAATDHGHVSTVVDHGAMGATETFDFADGSDHEGELDANLTVTLTGATNGEAAWMTTKLTNDGIRTLTAPASVVTKAALEAAFNTADNAVNVITWFSYDGGVTWYAFLAGTAEAAAAEFRWVPVSIDPAGDEAWEILFDDDGSVVMMEVYD